MDTTYTEILGIRNFLYLNVVKDVWNKEIVAYELSLSNNADLVDKTLEKLFKLPLAENCLIHTYTREIYSKTRKSWNKSFNV
mgnify:CR=1 FL=1